MNDLISRLAVRLIESDHDAYPQEWNDDYEKGFADCLEKVLALPSIDAVPQWIPCNEMLPDGRLNKSYLVQDKDGRLAVGTYTNWGWLFGNYMNDPVAWMPLPEPYERKES